MGDKQQLIELRDGFRETADFIDRLLALAEREEAGEDVNKEAEEVMALFMGKMMLLMMKMDNK
jgi:hypothetical protein